MKIALSCGQIRGHLNNQDRARKNYYLGLVTHNKVTEASNDMTTAQETFSITILFLQTTTQ